MLPEIEHKEYWKSLHRRSAEWWSEPLSVIAGREGLELARPERAPAGRNIVFLTSNWAVKLIPPFWTHMWERECVALEHVHGRLTVRTPSLRAAGRIDSWAYLVMERVDGSSLGWRAELGSLQERKDLAALQGRLAREISQLPPVESIRWDWQSVLEEDRRDVPAGLATAPEHLTRSAAGYLEAAGDLSSGGVFLHGDIASINLLTSGRGDWSLVDWSDASVGPIDHEFISPFMHQFRGSIPELESFWSAYGAVPDPEATQHRIMARSIIKYAALMSRLIEDLPGPVPASWKEAAERFTLIP